MSTRWWAMSFAAMVAVAGVGCNGGDGGGTNGASKLKTLVWARGADSTKLDPAVVTDGESVKVITNIFDTLLRFEPGTLNVRGGLAEEWGVSDDGLTWTFTLREANFHDGSPVDAGAVVFTFLRQKNADHPAHTDTFPYYHDNFGLIADVTAPDDRTVVMTLSQPDAAFEAKMTLFSSAIVSPKAFESEGIDPVTKKFKYRFSDNPVGSGPFTFKRWNRDDVIVLEANADYWDGPPGVDKVMFKTITDNNQRLISVETAQAHIMDGVNPKHAQRIDESEELVLATQPALNICYLSFNNQSPPFDNKLVRQACAYALSKPKIRAAAYDGSGDIAVVPVPLGMPGRNNDIVDRVQNIEKAKALLAEAGFPDGFETTLWHGNNPRPYLPRPRDVGTAVMQDLGQIGIKVTVEEMQWSSYIEATQKGEHNMCLLGWSADFGDPDNFLYVLLDKNNAVKGKANNVSFYTSEEVSELLTAARVETNREKRMGMYHRAQEIIFDDVPMVPLMQMPDIRAVHKSVKGYVIYPAGGEYLASVTLE